MKLSRREFVALGGAALLAKPALAQMKLGQFTVTAISDGALTLPSSFVFDGVAPDIIDALNMEFGLTETLRPPCNVTLLQSGARNILFDVGAGPEFMSSAGFALEALDAVGVLPKDITEVVFTHAHPDHIWGLVDDFDDLTFPNASYMMGADEWAYWTNPGTVDSIDDARTTFAVGAARRLARIADRTQFFRDGEEILPGIAARATYGHTPGHMAFEVRDGTEALMVLGDCIGNDHLAFRHPQMPYGADQDRDMGVSTRESLLDQLATDQMQVLGFHLPGNGIGRVVRDGGAFRFIQVD